MKIELTHDMRASNGVMIPAGTRLDFKNGQANYRNTFVERFHVPIQWIKNGKSVFVNAARAQVLNDNYDFQENIKKQYPAYCHCIAFGQYIFVYVWDTRTIIDVIDMSNHVKPQPIIRKLKGPNGQRIEKVVGWTKAWGKNLYKMIEWDQYQCLDNGLPLNSENKEWEKLATQVNSKAAKESYIPGLEAKDSKLTEFYKQHYRKWYDKAGLGDDAIVKERLTDREYSLIKDMKPTKVERDGPRTLNIYGDTGIVGFNGQGAFSVYFVKRGLFKGSNESFSVSMESCYVAIHSDHKGDNAIMNILKKLGNVKFMSDVVPGGIRILELSPKSKVTKADIRKLLANVSSKIASINVDPAGESGELVPDRINDKNKVHVYIDVWQDDADEDEKLNAKEVAWILKEFKKHITRHGGIDYNTAMQIIYDSPGLESASEPN